MRFKDEASQDTIFESDHSRSERGVNVSVSSLFLVK